MRLAHLVVVLAVHALAFWILRGPLTGDSFQDDVVRAMYIRVVAGASLAASLLAALAASRTGRQTLLLDLATLPALALAVARPAAAPITRDLAGLLLVAMLFARLAPVAAAILRGRLADARFAFLASLVLYVAVGSWGTVGMYAQGDQPVYLLGAESLRRGTVDLLDTYRGGTRYVSLVGEDLTDDDLRDHVVKRAEGGRPVQGYGLAVLVLPGWIVADRVGAAWMIALAGAAASALTFVLLREVVGAGWQAGAAWLLTAALAPLLPVTTSAIPNAPGAALLVAAFRWLFAAPRPRLAGVAAGLTLVLTPRDGFAAALLIPFALAADRAQGLRFLRALLAVTALVAVADFALYRLPVPYAGYLFGIAQLQETVPQPTLSFRPDVGLPGMLFDRAFGLLGSAPWVFIGALGVAPLLRARRDVARPALAVVAGSLAALSVYRLWQGGWAPPNRYLVDVLPLWAPFVASGLAVATSASLRAVAAILVAFSALMTLFLAGVPTLAYQLNENRTFEVLAKYVPAEPLFWLPSFHVDRDAAYAKSLVAFAALAALVVIGWRAARREASAPAEAPQPARAP